VTLVLEVVVMYVPPFWRSLVFFVLCSWQNPVSQPTSIWKPLLPFW